VNVHYPNGPIYVVERIDGDHIFVRKRIPYSPISRYHVTEVFDERGKQVKPRKGNPQAGERMNSQVRMKETLLRRSYIRSAKTQTRIMQSMEWRFAILLEGGTERSARVDESLLDGRPTSIPERAWEEASAVGHVPAMAVCSHNNARSSSSDAKVTCDHVCAFNFSRHRICIA